MPSLCHRLGVELGSNYPLFCIDEDFPSLSRSNITKESIEDGYDSSNSQEYIEEEHQKLIRPTRTLQSPTTQEEQTIYPLNQSRSIIQVIHLQKCFAPRNIIAILFRLSWLVLSCYNCRADYKLSTRGYIGSSSGVLYYFWRIVDYFGNDDHSHFRLSCFRYWAHLTHITMAVTIAYQVLSCLITVFSVFCCRRPDASFFAPRIIAIQTSSSSSPINQNNRPSHNNDNISRNNDYELSRYQGTSTGENTEEKSQGSTRIHKYDSLVQEYQVDHHHQQQQEHYHIYHHQPNLLLRLTWILYIIALITEFVVMIGYWGLQHQPGDKRDIQYLNIYKHGIIVALLFIDGFIIGRIPIRFKQYTCVGMYGLLYIAFSALYSFYLQDRYGDGYPIYGFLDWKRNPKIAAIVCAVCGGVSFIFFVICWMMSLWSCCCDFSGRGRFTREWRIST